MSKILVVASAGGHLTQAMCAVSNFNEVVLVSNKINIQNEKIISKYKILDTQFNFIIHFYNLFVATYILIKEKPCSVVSTGGPIAISFSVICKIIGTRFCYIDTLSRVDELSNTASFIKKYKLYDDMYCQWQHIATKNKIQYIGKCFDILGEEVKDLPRCYPDSNLSVLVTLGTNDYDFSRVFDFLQKLDIYHDKRVEWIFQLGKTAPIEPLPLNCRVHDTVTRLEMSEMVKRSSLVISHCGIGSINQMLEYQKKVFFIPRVKRYGEFSDDHQLQIAKELNSPRFEILYPDDEISNVSYDDLINYGLACGEVDIRNKKFSNKIFDILSH